MPKITCSNIHCQYNKLKKCRKNNVKSNRIQKTKNKSLGKVPGLLFKRYEILFFDGCYKIKIITFNIGSN